MDDFVVVVVVVVFVVVISASKNDAITVRSGTVRDGHQRRETLSESAGCWLI